MRAAYSGHSYRNETWPDVYDYMVRQSNAKLGIMSNINDLDADTVETFYVIDQELAKLRALEMKRRK